MYYHIPFQQNADFVGQTSVLNDIRTKLFGDEVAYRVAITGLGGSGKSQVALHIAYWVAQTKPEWSVFWVPVSSRERFEYACGELVSRVGLRRADTDDPKQLVHDYLNDKRSGRWLLIVDDANDEEIMFSDKEGPRGVHDFLPKTDHGRILFTTRSQQLAAKLAQTDIVAVPEMNAGEARSLLVNALEHEPHLEKAGATEIAKLAETLAFNPLAITQAAAYMKMNQISIAEYLQLLQHSEEDMGELLRSESSDQARNPSNRTSVAHICTLSFEQTRKHSGAMELLLFISYIEPEAIPESILPELGSKQRMIEAIAWLCGYSFLRRLSDSNTYNMHRLLHAVLRDWVRRERGANQQRIVSVANLARKFQTDAWETREMWLQYMPHVLKAIRGREEDWESDECDLAYWAGRCLLVEGRFREAANLLENVVTIHQKTLAETHPSQLESQHSLARAYHTSGRFKEATTLLERVVAIRQKTLAETHPSKLESQHALAQTYQASGRLKEATTLLEHVVACRKMTLAESHPDNLNSLHNLAAAYLANGRLKEAIALLEYIVSVTKITLGDSHPHLIASQHTLGQGYLADGRVKKAIALLEHVVAVTKTTLGELHPHLLASQHILAQGYLADGRPKEAIALLELVVAVTKTKLGESHPHLLASQNTLAQGYLADGRNKEAISLLEYVVAVTKTKLGESHPSLLALQHGLKQAYEMEGPVERIPLLSDSGYRSQTVEPSTWTGKEQTVHRPQSVGGECSQEPDIQRIPHLDTPEDDALSWADDAESTYSAQSTESSSALREHLTTIIPRLLQESSALGNTTVSSARESLGRTLPHLLKAFAVKIGYLNQSSGDREIMFQVQRKRKDIAREIQNAYESQIKPPENAGNISLVSESISSASSEISQVQDMESIKPPGVAMDHLEKVELWKVDAEVPPEEPINYENHILSSPAFKWFQGAINSEATLVTTERDIRKELHHRILRDLEMRESKRPKRGQPAHRHWVQLKILWDPITFLAEQKLHKDTANAITPVVALTRSHLNCQAITTAQYMQQTWPTTGSLVLRLLEHLAIVDPGIRRSIELPDSTFLEAWMDDTKLVAHAKGPAPSLAEIAEQLAWIGATLRTSPQPQGSWYCYPRLERSDIAPMSPNLTDVPSAVPAKPEITYLISFTTEQAPDTSSDANQCWRSMFGSVVIAHGFPIPRRITADTGLELSFDMMARLLW